MKISFAEAEPISLRTVVVPATGDYASITARRRAHPDRQRVRRDALGVGLTRPELQPQHQLTELSDSAALLGPRESDKSVARRRHTSNL